MAKNRNAASQRASKLKNNARADYRHPLKCSVSKCETEFYVSKPGYPAKRFCEAHTYKPTTVKPPKGLLAVWLSTTTTA